MGRKLTVGDEKRRWKLEFGLFLPCGKTVAMRAMKVLVRVSLIGGVCLLGLASCGGGGENTPTANESATQVLEPGLSPADDEQAGFEALQDRFAYDATKAFDSEGFGRNRSQFEGKQMTHIGGDLGNKQFAASRYTKKLSLIHI